MKKVIWGILGTARIGNLKVIPAMQQSDWIDVRAIASRSESAANRADSEDSHHGSVHGALPSPSGCGCANWSGAEESENCAIQVFFSYYNDDLSDIPYGLEDALRQVQVA